MVSTVRVVRTNDFLVTGEKKQGGRRSGKKENKRWSESTSFVRYAGIRESERNEEIEKKKKER